MWKAWLGEAISIKDPTCAVFRPQAGSNLVIVGQHEEIGIGLTFASMVSIAAQLVLHNYLHAKELVSSFLTGHPPIRLIMTFWQGW